MEGSKITKVSDSITLTCISPEASEFLDFLYSQWGLQLRELMRVRPPEDIAYSLLYWLVRYSGFVEPSEYAKAIMSGDQNAPTSREDAARRTLALIASLTAGKTCKDCSLTNRLAQKGIEKAKEA